jgi:uncharacterized membrane protein
MSEFLSAGYFVPTLHDLHEFGVGSELTLGMIVMNMELFAGTLQAKAAPEKLLDNVDQALRTVPYVHAVWFVRITGTHSTSASHLF